MTGILLGGLGTALGSFASAVVEKLFGGPSSDERLGQEETKDANDRGALDEVQRAEDARQSAGASDAGRVPDNSDPAAAPYRDGPQH